MTLPVFSVKKLGSELYNRPRQLHRLIDSKNTIILLLFFPKVLAISKSVNFNNKLLKKIKHKK